MDQTLILLNSSQYASLCVERLNSWNIKLTNLKSNLRTDSSTKHEDWVNQLSKVESDLNGLFEEVSNDNPVQPDDVVILSRYSDEVGFGSGGVGFRLVMGSGSKSRIRFGSGSGIKKVGFWGFLSSRIHHY